ncbi:hypothetical protein [Myxococcus llanfairpwllgwyngyllgogerychwyrndrobwllllantysiliogogogochensis]|uniref:hypothetical protein n=1 Tax=Myxococcus llanfairpwllgwyngyllgogerychwyrndrobwllllantysiliogogogochensis TaxID=2590453 RepID=UPI001FE67973|nr:hypothetical protein [Myxococcus llanfairpwllgwyngyllgogerychwyrndrobwllllantysiliogogogochensis]
MNSKSSGPGLLAVLALILVLPACDSVPPGDVRVTMSGGDGTQRGLPDTLFQDGWSVQFTKYLVSLGDFTLTSASGEARESRRHVLVDVQKGDIPLTELTGLPAGRWDVGFRVSPPRDDTELADGQVSTEDLAMMRERGFSYWVEGRAVKAGVGIFDFRMGFPVDARMVDCINGVDGTQGIIVPEGSRADVEVTIHAEHMFYDRLGTHRGVQLRFDAIAATATSDHLITPEGLASQQLTDLKDAQGRELRDAAGQPVVYLPGAHDVRTLQQFVTQSIVDQAHLNGGGVCTVAK